MKLARALAAPLLACAAFLTSFCSFPAWSQAPAATYEVRKGEGLFAVARKLQYPGVTVFQMVVSIHAANADAFPGGSVHSLREGQILRIPGRDEVAAVAPAEATSRYRSLIAKPGAPAPAPVAAIRPAPPAAAPPKPAAPMLGREQAAQRYRDGLALEQKGDDAGALKAFLDAAEAGHGLAQRRLGQIYDKGNTAVQRDYQASLRWYQKAREQGVEIDKPLPRVVPTK